MLRLKQQLLRVDTALFALATLYAVTPVFSDVSIEINLQTSCPRVVVELANLLIIGFIERWVVLAAMTYFDEHGLTTSLRSRALPHSKQDRLSELSRAMASAWLHNKNAIIACVLVLLPLDLTQGITVETIHISAKTLWKHLLVGMLVLDLILGTAHMLSHQGWLKRHLWPFHATHHSQHVNYPTVKYIGQPFDLEVFLTQMSYAFLARSLGFDVFTGMMLIDGFGLQLLLEHSGYCKYSALAQHHEAHHRYGSVAFYHFPVVECLLGRMPTPAQLEVISGNCNALDNERRPTLLRSCKETNDCKLN